MATPSIRAGDIGVGFQIEVLENDAYVDISAGTSPKLLFRSPTKKLSNYTASIVNNSGTWELMYTTAGTEFLEVGIWSVEGQFTLGSWTGTTSPNTFEVQQRYQ